MSLTKRILETRQSEINGTLTVEYELGWGTFIRGGGLPQSGGLAKTIWEKSLKHVSEEYKTPNSILILGFGGGGIAQIVKKLWPDTKIYGVDIDPVMVELGKKYLKWEETGARVFVEDAIKFVKKIKKDPTVYKLQPNTRFDIVCVDMYVQDKVPKQFNTKTFIKSIKSITSKNGLSIFNRLYGDEDKNKAHKFLEKLELYFDEVEAIFPHANVMYVCK